MKIFSLACSCFVALALSHVAQAEPDAPPPDMNMQDMMKAMGQIMQGGSNAVSVVDFRALKALLPLQLTDMKRTSASGEKTGMMGMTVAYAEGSYQSEEGATIDIKITDMAGTGALGGFTRAGWSNMEIDRESDTGYERTSTIEGAKAYEKYDSDSKSGEFQLMVKERFMVEIHGSGVPADRLKEAVDKIDLAKLGELAPAAAPAAVEPQTGK